MKAIKISAALLVMFLFSQCGKDTATPIADVDCSTVTYSGVIKSLVASKCAVSGCHGSGSHDGDFTTYAKIAPYANNGSIRQEVLVTMRMPQSGSLTSEQLGQFQCWLDSGAPNN